MKRQINRKIWSLTGVILASVGLFCLSLHAININSSKFATPNGLSDNTVRAIHQDSRGYLWFGTFDGLSRYDGYNITPVIPKGENAPLVDSQIRNIIEDSSGFLWIMGAHGIVSCYDVNNEVFVNFISPDTPVNYLYIKELQDGNIFLWGGEGAVKVSHTPDGLLQETIIDNQAAVKNVTRLEQLSDGRILMIVDGQLWEWKEGFSKLIDDSQDYQWILPLPNTTLLISSLGEVAQLTKQNGLKHIYTIPNITKASDLPGAFENNGKWHILSKNGGISIDSKTLAIEPIRKDKDLLGGQIIRDNLGGIWLHNETGILYFYDISKDKLVPLRLYPESMLNLIDMERFSVSRDKQGNAWITTGGNGLFIFNPIDYSLEQFTTSGGNYQVIPSDRLLSTALDQQGNIWVGAENGGVAMLNFDTKGAESLPINSGVRSINRLKSGEIVIATMDGKTYTYSAALQNPVVRDRNTIIYDIDTDNRGNVIEATRGGGLIINGVHKDSPELTSDDIFTIMIDNSNRLWVGTFGSGLDVIVPSNDGRSFESYNFLNETYGQKRIRDIFQDSKGYVWIATNEGAYRVNPDKFIAGEQRATVLNKDNGKLRSNEVHTFVEDSQGRIWIGEADNGISIVEYVDNSKEPNIKHIGEENGLSNNNVQSLVKDGDYIWVTTLYGVSKINSKTLEIESFAFLPMPGQNVHTSNSALLLDDGRLLFGTNQGAYTINPNEIRTVPSEWPITVTSFKVNGEQLPFTPVNKRLSMKDGKYYLELPYDQNSLDFAFSTFDFSLPKQTRFRYKLEPIDDSWSEATIENNLSFKNLAPGKYTLLVESCDASGKWDKKWECVIKINVPWWSSWWAKTLYFLLIVFGIILIIRVVQRINNLNNKVKIEEQLTDYKLEFFTNISHEFRTPLTLIQVSLEKLHDKLLGIKDEYPSLPLNSLKMPLSTLDKNTRRMSRLIDELLTFRKVEKGKMVLYPEQTECIGFLKEIFENFRDEAVSKRISFEFRADRDEFEMNVDRNALEKIANNLISNALKYTREGGKVSVHVTVDSEKHLLKLQVIDNGVGIAPEKREQLFTRFMQSAMSRNSIGVGLHLTFGLVELHKGSIAHSDNEGGGSIFTVTLPTDLNPSERRHDEGIGKPTFDTIFKNEEPIEVATALPDENERKKMLIIDDDADIRNFLSTEFSRYYVILLASDGQSGLEAARNNDVHIIICDVMMPDMSGFEVTRLLKEDFATSHIPIIQLTALTNDDCQVEGITSGADAYVTKPFNLRYLMTRVAKLIEQRENLFAKFSANPTLARPQLPMGDKDKEFADKLAEIAEREIDNADFSVDDFAAEMALGRTIFFRKVKGVTGYSPKEYLRVMRMKKAAELLLTTDLTISEIAYKVGISDPAYFNKCFKAQFGKAPSVYQKENTEN